jgi:hypothetical protein
MDHPYLAGQQSRRRRRREGMNLSEGLGERREEGK